MGAVAYRARAELRRHRRSVVALIVLVGLTGGVALATAAGARRTASAYPELMEDLRAGELFISPSGDGTGTNGFYDAMARVEGVAGVGAELGLSVIFHPDSPEGRIVVAGAKGVLDADGFGYETNRVQLLDGRMPAVDALDEILVNRSVADQGVEVGDDVELAVVGLEYWDTYEFTGAVERISATVVGIGASPDEVVPFNDLSREPWLTVSPALTEHIGLGGTQFEGAAVDLAPDADVDRVREEMLALASGRFAADLPEGLFVSDQQEPARAVQDGIRPLSVSLWLFSLVVAVVGAVVLGLLLRRHVEPTGPDRVALAGVGFARREHAAVAALRSGVIGVAAGGLAVGLAVLVSPRFPIGPARLAEPSPGVEIDWLVLGVGAGAIALFTVTVTLGSHRRRPARPARTGLGYWISPAATAGLRAALTGGASGPRLAIAAGTIGIASVLAVGQFGTDLDRLVTEPARYGQQWDRVLDAQFGPIPAGSAVDRYRADDRVVAVAGGTYGELHVDGRTVPTIGWLDLHGSVGPTVSAGRLPQGPGEVALGREVMDQLGTELGDRIVGDAGGGRDELVVVGEVVLPRFNLGSFLTVGLGEGAVLHADALQPLTLDPAMAQELPPGFVHEGRLFNFVAFDLTSTSPQFDRELEALVQGEFAYVRTDMRPITITDLGRVRAVPAVLAAVLAVLGLAMLAHALTASVRGRRRELAVLRTLGFVRRELSATVRWQASAIALVAFAIGSPLGAALGRTVWSEFARSIHVPPATSVPSLLLGGLAVATAALANLIAVLPARRAARVRPATALRTE